MIQTINTYLLKKDVTACVHIHTPPIEMCIQSHTESRYILRYIWKYTWTKPGQKCRPVTDDAPGALKHEK